MFENKSAEEGLRRVYETLNEVPGRALQRCCRDRGWERAMILKKSALSFFALTCPLEKRDRVGETPEELS